MGVNRENGHMQVLHLFLQEEFNSLRHLEHPRYLPITISVLLSFKKGQMPSVQTITKNVQI